MKIVLYTIKRRRNSEQGSAVILILAFLAIMVLLVAANTKTVNLLRADVRLIDHQQAARLNASVTNQTASATANMPVTNSP
jgi:hypothetical protein